MAQQTNVLETLSLPLKRFTWNKMDHSLSAEASDFGPARDGHWWMGPLYNDAIDVGLSIKSERTGKVERFFLCETLKDREGDIQGWRFKPVNPRLATVQSVVIFND